MAWGKLVWLATTVAGLGQYYGTDEHKVRLLVSTMSPTGAINVGAGCLFVAFASQDDEFE